MKAKEFRAKRPTLNESYYSIGGQRDPHAIRAQIIQMLLAHYKEEPPEHLIVESLADYMEAIGARGNESPAMTKLMKIAMKLIMEDHDDAHEEGYLVDLVDNINAGCERLKKLGVFPDLLTAMQKSIAARVKDELDSWDNPDEQY